MARPRSFDEDIVVDAAMTAFWQTGFSETPIGVLEKATGLKRVSIYNTFGDKEGLFLAALDRYHLNAMELYDGNLAHGGLDAIQHLFTSMSAETTDNSPANSGCLMVNTILDVRRMSEAVQSRVATYRAMLQRSFTSALRNARDAGDMNVTDDVIDARATYLVGMLWGALALIRTEGRTTAAADLAHVGNAAIEGWK